MIARFGPTEFVVRGSPTIRLVLNGGLLALLTLLLMACSDEPAPTTEPDAPVNATYFRHEFTALKINWDTVDGADDYNVHHNTEDECVPNGSGSCERIGHRVIESTYLHTSPGQDQNHYWISACNSVGCSGVSKAEWIDKSSPGPTNVQAEFLKSEEKVRITWNPVEEAEYYHVYFVDSFFSEECSTDWEGIPRGGGSPFGCNLAQKNLVDTHMVDHTDYDDDHLYFVAACNGGGCSDPVKAIRR